MITDLISNFILWVDSIFNNIGLYSALSTIITKINTYQSYVNDMQYYVRGAYFIFGKPLIIFVLSISATIFIVSLIGAIVNIVSQFIP